MSVGLFLKPNRVVYILIGIVLIVTSAGCAPTLPAGLSGDDMYTCDDTMTNFMKASDISGPDSGAFPYQKRPGPADIISPVSGSALPFGSVLVKFKQPPADPGVAYRNLRIIVNPIDSTIGPQFVGNAYKIVPASTSTFEISWIPQSPGKFIIVVLLRNLKTTGDDISYLENELYLESSGEHGVVKYGKFSVAYVCVKVEAPKPGAVSSAPVKIIPVDSIPTRTATLTSTVTLIPSATWVPSSTFTAVPSLTPTKIKTLIPTKPSATSTPTEVPPVNCGQYTDMDHCNLDQACIWDQGPTGAEVCKNK